jgi:NAD-dependent dihydropyrimidine dehydrogenase PreA subunit
MTGVSIPLERRNRLKELVRLMNRQNEMPVLPIRQVVEILDYDITDGELDFLLQLGTKARTGGEIAALSGMDSEECNGLLDRLIQKGFLWPEPGGEGRAKLQLAPFVVGWLEIQLFAGQDSPKSREFARRLENLFQSFFKLNVFPVRNLGNLLTRRMLKPYQTIGSIHKASITQNGAAIPVNRRVDYASSTVFPIQDAYELVDRHGAGNQVAVVNCFCRRWRYLTEDPCRFDLPFESCVAVGPLAEYIRDRGFGRKIQKNDALKLLEEMAQAGAIHTLFHEKDDTTLPNVAVCNCCWDCCGLYGSFNRGMIPLYFKSHYLARVKDPESCKACMKCEEHCPTGAVSVQDDRPEIQEKKCIGCGQCALQCPTNTIGLEPLTRDVLVPLEKKSEARLS